MPLVEQAAQDGLIGQVIGWVVGVLGALLSALFGLIWKKHNEEITALKDAMKEVKIAVDSKVDVAVFDKTEDRMRTGVIDLYHKIDQSTDDLYKKIDENERVATARHIELLNALRNIK